MRITFTQRIIVITESWNCDGLCSPMYFDSLIFKVLDDIHRNLRQRTSECNLAKMNVLLRFLFRYCCHLKLSIFFAEFRASVSYRHLKKQISYSRKHFRRLLSFYLLFGRRFLWGVSIDDGIALLYNNSKYMYYSMSKFLLPVEIYFRLQFIFSFE